MSVAMSGRAAWFCRLVQRASGGTQKTRSAGVLVAALQQALKLRTIDSLGFQFVSKFIASRLKRVGDVLQKKQTEDNMLVLGSIDLPTQRVGGLPENLGVGQITGGYVIIRHASFRSLSFGCQTLGRIGRYNLPWDWCSSPR